MASAKAAVREDEESEQSDSSSSSGSEDAASARANHAILLGPAAACLAGVAMAFLRPPGLEPPAQRLLAMTLWMVVWWMSEAVPLGITALVPLLTFPLLGIMRDTEVVKSYSTNVAWMFFGGFQLAFAIEKAGLHRRFAFMVLRVVGMQPACIMLGVMCASATLSMFLSNTSTTIMLLPVVEAITTAVEAADCSQQSFGKAILLGLAYSASSGGLGSLIGTPPNGILAAQAPLFGLSIGFQRWMVFAAPLSIIMVLLIWLFLVTRFQVRNTGTGNNVAFMAFKANLGPMSVAEWRVSMVFLLTVLAWMVRRPVATALDLERGFLEDDTISIAAVIALFIVPVRGRAGRVDRLMDWPTLLKTPWHILFLFGGGFALATAFKQTGLSKWIGGGLVCLRGMPSFVMVLTTVLLMTFLTEVTSNTATASVLLPIIGELARSLGISPVVLMIPATLAASCAFMLPVATAPNAIVCATHRITMKDMATTGFLINLGSSLLITAWCFTWGRLWFRV